MIVVVSLVGVVEGLVKGDESLDDILHEAHSPNRGKRPQLKACARTDTVLVRVPLYFRSRESPLQLRVFSTSRCSQHFQLSPSVADRRSL